MQTANTTATVKPLNGANLNIVLPKPKRMTKAEREAEAIKLAEAAAAALKQAEAEAVQADLAEKINAAEEAEEAGKSNMLAWFAGVAAATGVGAGIVTIVAAGVALLSSMWLSWILTVAGWLLAIYAGIKASSIAYDYIAEGTVTEHFDDACEAVKSVGGWISSLFDKKPEVAKPAAA